LPDGNPRATSKTAGQRACEGCEGYKGYKGYWGYLSIPSLPPFDLIY